MTTEERLEKMEIELKRAMRYNRILLAVVLLAAAAMTVAVAMTAGKSVSHENIIKASGFILVDEKGKERAILAMGGGEPSLELRDENEKLLASLSILFDEPILSLHGADANCNYCAVLGVFENGPGLRLIGENGKSRASLAMAGDSPLLGLVDEKGNIRAGLSVFKDGTRLILSDESGKSRASLSVVGDSALLGLSDEKGEPRVGLNVDKDGSSLALFDSNGKNRANLGIGKTTTPDGKVVTYPESSLILFNPDGTVVWRAPQ